MKRKEVEQALSDLHKEACAKCVDKCKTYDETLKCKVYININKLLEQVGT